MPDHNLPTWPYTLPAALLLMAPFDILASLAMDIYLPVVPEMPGILGTSPASKTRPIPSGNGKPSSILRNGAFWTYTLGFSTAMGAFFVFFSTAPRLLIDRAGYSQFGFSLAFATAAVVMILTTRFAKGFVGRYGMSGCLMRGMAALILGGLLLAAGEVFTTPSFASFVLPMWVIAVGIVMSASVTANGALKAFDAIAGTAVALYFCIQSLIVAVVGTGAVLFLKGDTAWPLVGYCLVMATVTLLALALLSRRGRQ